MKSTCVLMLVWVSFLLMCASDTHAMPQKLNYSGSSKDALDALVEYDVKQISIGLQKVMEVNAYVAFLRVCFPRGGLELRVDPVKVGYSC